jgi:hypothetical protein
MEKKPKSIINIDYPEEWTFFLNKNLHMYIKIGCVYTG